MRGIALAAVIVLTGCSEAGAPPTKQPVDVAYETATRAIAYTEELRRRLIEQEQRIDEMEQRLQALELERTAR